jgi:hypothetical protein
MCFPEGVSDLRRPAGSALRDRSLGALRTAGPNEKEDAETSQHGSRHEPASGLGNVQVGSVVAHAVGPAEHETEERSAEKHNAKGEQRFAARAARSWIGRCHECGFSFVSAARHRGQTICHWPAGCGGWPRSLLEPVTQANIISQHVYPEMSRPAHERCARPGL